MKKFLTLSLFAMIFTACSTDDASLSQEEQTAVAFDSNSADDAGNEYRGNTYRMSQGECADSVEGYVYADGLMNPNIYFGVDVTINSRVAKNTYRVTLQLQPLSDCDNMNSNSGSVISYSIPGLVTSLTQTLEISIRAQNLPSGCYKWRYVIEGIRSGAVFCTSETQWYESPLF